MAHPGVHTNLLSRRLVLWQKVFAHVQQSGGIAAKLRFVYVRNALKFHVRKAIESRPVFCSRKILEPLTDRDPIKTLAKRHCRLLIMYPGSRMIVIRAAT